MAAQAGSAVVDSGSRKPRPSGREAVQGIDLATTARQGRGDERRGGFPAPRPAGSWDWLRAIRDRPLHPRPVQVTVALECSLGPANSRSWHGGGCGGSPGDAV